MFKIPTPAAARRMAAQSLVEYSLLISLVAVVATASLVKVGGSIATLFSNLATSV